MDLQSYLGTCFVAFLDDCSLMSNRFADRQFYEDWVSNHYDIRISLADELHTIVCQMV